MTTFLEYLLTKYLGKPARRSGNGVSYWPCPVCGHDSFHTLPDKPLMKHRAKCWNAECGFRGDDYDMLKEFYPDEDFNERLDRRTHLLQDYQQRNRPPHIGRGVRRKGDATN